MRNRGNHATDIDEDLPISHAITDGWEEFAVRGLPAIRGTKHAEAHVAFHFGAMCVLQLALGMLDAKLTNS
jgi:hypothetical protein